MFITLLEATFIVLMLGIILLFIFWLLLTWAWAQTSQQDTSFSELVSTAAIEWGATITLLVSHFRPRSVFHEAPPLHGKIDSKRQLPVIFVPSLHTGRGLFSILHWRLQKNFFASLWPFSWRSFLVKRILLEDQLETAIHEILRKTGAPTFRIVSFGSSYPIVSRVLSKEPFAATNSQWVAISAPAIMTPVYRFLSTARLRQAYSDSPATRVPDLLVRGSHDVVAYGEEVWPKTTTTVVHPVGHYSALLHPNLVQSILTVFQK